MMAIERRPGSERRGKRLNIDRYQAVITQSKSKIQEAIEPHTVSGKVRRAVIHSIPFRAIRERLEIAPLDEALGEMRGSIIDLYNNMGDIMRSGTELRERFIDVSQQLEVVEANPDNKDVVRDLRDLLRSKAEEDLKIKRDPQTEELLEHVLEPDDPEKEARLREKTIFEAKRTLQVSKTIADIGENIAVNTAQTFETATSEYSVMLDVKKTVSVLHRSGRDLMTAHQLRIQTFNTLTGEMDLLIKTAYLATDVQKRTTAILQPSTDKAEKQIEAPKPVE